MAETSYRMGAPRAYAQLSTDRLQSLAVGPVRGHPTLADFTERLLIPAMRTCNSFSRRLEDLLQRVAWTSSLLRTRVDTELARQNRDLLDSMNRRARLQLRLQQTVEGLSVVAISYSLVGLLGHVFMGLHEKFSALQPEIATGAAVPVVALLVIPAMRWIRRSLEANGSPKIRLGHGRSDSRRSERREPPYPTTLKNAAAATQWDFKILGFRFRDGESQECQSLAPAFLTGRGHRPDRMGA
jgi:uncharacterized membrane-anchored protein